MVEKYNNIGNATYLTDGISCIYIVRLTIRASCQMDLADFPMDNQKCPLRIGSCKYF